jgi:uncharacterized protein (TIGR00369 family)
MVDLLDTYIENRYRVNPSHANNHGTVHGGNVMKWMDEIGALSAMRAAGQPCVTASIDQMNFHRPIPVGDTALIESYAYATGRTSIRVRLRAFRERPRTGESERTTESRFVFVAIDEDGQPTPVQGEVETPTPREQELLDAATVDGDDEEA